MNKKLIWTGLVVLSLASILGAWRPLDFLQELQGRFDRYQENTLR